MFYLTTIYENYYKVNPIFSQLFSGCWMLDTGFWLVIAGFWILLSFYCHLILVFAS